MSPSAEPAIPAAVAAMLPAERLEDGEAIILAVKPTRWFVLLVSWPWIVLAAAVAGGAYLASQLSDVSVNTRAVALVCSAVACTRVTAACFQWQSRLYVLTDRRILRFRGVFREDLSQCPLRSISQVYLTAALPERLVAAGSLWFERDDEKPGAADGWVHLADPKEVRQAVEQARARVR